jgi:signal transduction histidine kinase
MEFRVTDSQFDDPEPTRRPLGDWRLWPLLVAFWTVPAILLATQIYYLYQAESRQISWWHLFGWEAAGWYFWVPATPLVLRFCRRCPFPGGRPWLSATIHLLLAVLLAGFHAIYLTVITKQLGPEPFSTFPVVHILGMWAAQRLFLDLLTYGALLGIGYGREAYRKECERELLASQLQTQLAQAQLQALKMQLHPHFLFNTLHAISVLVRKNANQQAVRMLAGLSDLLRLALENVGTQEVSLKQELEFLERYLELEQIRFQDRLRIELDIEPETLDTQVPNMILQPLVENAIRHGISQNPAAGIVRVLARRDEKRLRVEVHDDGPGLSSDAGRPHREGVGLSNTRKRLQRLYGDEHKFEVGNGERGGALVVVELPLRFAHR